MNLGQGLKECQSSKEIRVLRNGYSVALRDRVHSCEIHQHLIVELLSSS